MQYAGGGRKEAAIHYGSRASMLQSGAEAII